MANTTIESIVDKAALIDRFHGDGDLVRQMIEAFLEVCPGLMAEVRRASRDRAGEDFERAVHVLKGAVGSLFAQSAYEVAQNLENRGLRDDPLVTEEVLQVLEKEASILAHHLAAMREELAAAKK